MYGCRIIRALPTSSCASHAYPMPEQISQQDCPISSPFLEDYSLQSPPVIMCSQLRFFSYLFFERTAVMLTVKWKAFVLHAGTSWIISRKTIWYGMNAIIRVVKAKWGISITSPLMRYFLEGGGAHKNKGICTFVPVKEMSYVGNTGDSSVADSLWQFVPGDS